MISLKNIIGKFAALIVFVLLNTGCDMPLQQNYDYESSVLDPHISATAWDFLQTKSDLFSIFTEAVEYAGLDNYYKQTERKYTFLVLNNTAMKLYMMDRFPGTNSITECDRDQVRDMLLYHIVDGEYSGYGQLPVEPMFVLTLLKGDQGLMTMLVRKNPWQADAGKIVINDTGSNGSSPMRLATTSNLLPVNGVIHIFENYSYYKKSLLTDKT